MTFSSSGLRQLTPGGLSAGAGALWMYTSSDPSTTVANGAYFTAAGRGSKGGAAVGLQVGDVVIVQESSGGNTPYRCTVHGVKSSTASFSSSNASSAYATFGFDASVAAAT